MLLIFKQISFYYIELTLNRKKAEEKSVRIKNKTLENHFRFSFILLPVLVYFFLYNIWFNQNKSIYLQYNQTSLKS